MPQTNPLHQRHQVLVRSQSRRTILKSCGAFGVALMGMRQWSPDALAAPVASVAAPNLLRDADCFATVSVAVTLSGISPRVRYEVHGNLMDLDEPDGDPDVCGVLPAQATSANHQQRQVVVVTAQMRAADLGLVKGMGPSHDETFSPDLVELFARIWLRDLTTGDERGPWDSPVRVVVSSAALDWTHPRPFPGSELLVPRSGKPAAPPQACIS